MSENELLLMTEEQRRFNDSNMQRFLDNEWNNLDVVEKSEYLFGDTAEAEAAFKQSKYYEEE